MKTGQPKASTKFYTIKQIAQLVEASTRTVRRWIKNGLLIAHRVNGLVRISEGDFQAFLATHRDRQIASPGVTRSHDMSIAYGRSGILHTNIRSICYMLVCPNVHSRPSLSSRGSP